MRDIPPGNILVSTGGGVALEGGPVALLGDAQDDIQGVPSGRTATDTSPLIQRVIFFSVFFCHPALLVRIVLVCSLT